MPLISTRGHYGLMAMYSLSLHYAEHPMTVREISQSGKMPQKYLEQILSKLRKAGLIQSTRGPKGGYSLVKSPDDISILEILRVLEDDLSVVDKQCSHSVLTLFFNKTQNDMYKLFDCCLSDLDEYQDKTNEYLHYSI